VDRQESMATGGTFAFGECAKRGIPASPHFQTSAASTSSVEQSRSCTGTHTHTANRPMGARPAAYNPTAPEKYRLSFITTSCSERSVSMVCRCTLLLWYWKPPCVRPQQRVSHFDVSTLLTLASNSSLCRCRCCDGRNRSKFGFPKTTACRQKKNKDYR
jgi:hypothetical protein